MNSALLERTSFNLDWVNVLRRVKQVGAYAIVFALGGWVARINDGAADIPYKTSATAHYEQVEKVAGPNPVAKIKCLTVKSAIATSVAKQAVSAATADNNAPPVPNLAQIPNCQPKPAPKPK